MQPDRTHWLTWLNDEQHGYVYVSPLPFHLYGGPEYRYNTQDGTMTLLSEVGDNRYGPHVHAQSPTYTIAALAERGWRPEYSVVIPVDDPRHLRNGGDLDAPYPNVSQYVTAAAEAPPVTVSAPIVTRESVVQLVKNAHALRADDSVVLELAGMLSALLPKVMW